MAGDLESVATSIVKGATSTRPDDDISVNMPPLKPNATAAERAEYQEALDLASALVERGETLELSAAGINQQAEVLSAEFQKAVAADDSELATDIQAEMDTTEIAAQQTEAEAARIKGELAGMGYTENVEDVNPADVQAVKEALEKFYVGMSFQIFQQSMAAIKEMDKE